MSGREILWRVIPYALVVSYILTNINARGHVDGVNLLVCFLMFGVARFVVSDLRN